MESRIATTTYTQLPRSTITICRIVLDNGFLTLAKAHASIRPISIRRSASGSPTTMPSTSFGRYSAFSLPRSAWLPAPPDRCISDAAR